MDILCCAMLAMPFWEEGMLAEMFCEQMENGGLVQKRTEFVCEVLLLLIAAFTAVLGPLLVHECLRQV